MKIGIIINSSKEKALPIADKTINSLLNFGAEVFVTEEYKNQFQNVQILNEDDIYLTSDIVAVIGGDGTIIHTAKKAAKFSKPLLGINAGRLGYLAGLEANDLSKLEKLVTNNFVIKNRMLLSVTVGDAEYLCLNDAVISKGPLSRMIDISVTLKGECVSYRADGLIFATPTGSTAYSLSAGGPIVDPDLDSIILTPICPQSLYARPILISPDDEIAITAIPPEGTGAYLTIDGEEVCPILPNQKITVRRAKDLRAGFIKLQEGVFFNALANKFNFSK